MFAFASLSTWARVLLDNPRVSAERLPTLLGALGASALTTPLRIAETLRYGRAIARTRIEHPPLFVLGYARSGTTHLHNLFSKDPALGFVTTFQALAPGFAMIGERWIKPVLARAVPVTRPTDNVEIDLDSPQEEEVAIANLSATSMLHHMSFPSRHDEYFRRRVLMEGISSQERAEFMRTYLRVARTATLRCGGKRLVLKCPLNMARLPMVLELFPEARFVHIVRNPYEVYPSLVHLYEKMLGDHHLEPIDRDQQQHCILEHYRLSFEAFARDRVKIPAHRISEIRYEDLRARPLDELQRVYEELSLPGWDAARQPLAEYTRRLEGYQRNAYRLDDATRERVREHWRRQFEAWSYPT